MPGCLAVAPGGRGSAALVFPFLVIVAVGTGKTDGRACRRVTAAAISPAQGHRSASRSRRSAMTFPGSWTARGARHRASPADRPRARPVTRIVSHSKTALACETRPRPSADTTTPSARALFLTRKSAFDSNRMGP